MSYETNDKMVSHPDHYKSGKYEVIDIIDEFTKDLSGTEAVCTANAIKYILRWKKKNGIQDVKKAIWYLQHMVDKEEERLREEHAEFDEERLEKKLNRIRENSVYGIPKDEELLNEELKEEPTCSDCTFYEKGNCKFLNMHTMSDHDACGYLDPKTKEKEVDMDKIMNRPTFIDVKEEKKFINNTGEELNIPEFLEGPTDEEIHDCSDCRFRVNDPNIPPCADCDLHPDPPTNWAARN